MTDKEKLHSGDIYYPSGDEIMNEQLACLDKQYDFNLTRPTELKKREKMLKDMFAEIGEGCYIEPPLHSNWGGHHTHFGKYVYANFNLTLVDDTHIFRQQIGGDLQEFFVVLAGHTQVDIVVPGNEAAVAHSAQHSAAQHIVFEVVVVANLYDRSHDVHIHLVEKVNITHFSKSFLIWVVLISGVRGR